MSPSGPLTERSSWEIGCPEMISSTAGTGLARIAGINSGVMVVGKLSPASSSPNCGS
jgi:hypothetical protein